MQSIWMSFAVLVYLAAVACLGYLGYVRTRTTSDYLVGGRATHPYVTAMSYGATFISTSAIVGFGGVAAVYGMSLMWLVFLNIFVGIFLAFVLFGGRTRQMGLRLDAHTFPEFLGRRFQSGFIQACAAVIILLFMPLYTAAVLMGAAKFIAAQLGFSYKAALFLFAAIVAVYVVLGGIKGVMYTDALQATIMVVGMAVLLVLTYVSLGGLVSAHRELSDLLPMVPAKLAAAGHRGWTSMPAFGSPWWWTLVSTIMLGVGIGVLAQPQLAVRYMTVKSQRELNRAVPIGGLFILLTVGVAYAVGPLTNVYFHRLAGQIALEAAGFDVERIIPLYVKNAMPGWFAALFMLTLLSAAMSTLSGQFHAMGTSLGRRSCRANLGLGSNVGRVAGHEVRDRVRHSVQCLHRLHARKSVRPNRHRNRGARHRHFLWDLRVGFPSDVRRRAVEPAYHPRRHHRGYARRGAGEFGVDGAGPREDLHGSDLVQTFVWHTVVGDIGVGRRRGRLCAHRSDRVGFCGSGCDRVPLGDIGDLDGFAAHASGSAGTSGKMFWNFRPITAGERKAGYEKNNVGDHGCCISGPMESLRRGGLGPRAGADRSSQRVQGNVQSGHARGGAGA
jgi:SSS family solute:Na+ symporter